MDLQTLKTRVLDVAIPTDVKRSEIVPKKILCSEGAFAAFELENGKFGAIWTAHLDVVDTKEDLGGILNQHERTLLALGINK